MKKPPLITGLCLFALLAGCAPPGGGNGDGGSPRLGGDSRFASAPIPARLIANSLDDVAEVMNGAANLTDEILLNRQGVRFVEASSLPYLTTSVEGAAYLAAPGARGEPAASCPAAAVAAGAETRAAAVGDATRACFAQLEARGAGPECGCRIAALDEFLLDRRQTFGFATSVSALIMGGDRPPAHIIAEALPPENGAQEVILRDLNGVIGGVLLSGETASLRLASDPARIYRGDRTRFGFRRGRMAERLVLADDAGVALSVLIGVERRDVTRN